MILSILGNTAAARALRYFCQKHGYVLVGDRNPIRQYTVEFQEAADVPHPRMDSVDCELESRIWGHLRKLDPKSQLDTDGPNKRTDKVVIVYRADDEQQIDTVVRAVWRGIEDLTGRKPTQSWWKQLGRLCRIVGTCAVLSMLWHTPVEAQWTTVTRPYFTKICFDNANKDVGLERDSAGVLKITDCAGSLRDLKLRNLQINAGTGILLKDATGELQVRTVADDGFRILRAGQITGSNFVGEPLSNTIIRGVSGGAIQLAKDDFTAYWSINNASGFLQSNLSTGNIRADTVLFQNSAGTGAPTLMQFGGTTASFPALERSGAELRKCLADGTGCAILETRDNKDAASGYAGLTAGTKLNLAQGQEVWGAADLTDYASTSGTGTAAIRSTITTPATNDVLTWNGTNWINQAGGAGGGDNISVNGVAATDADFDDATPAAPAGALNIIWQKDALTPTNVSAYIDANAVSNTVLRDSAATSVIGRSANSTGDPADISASVDGFVLRRAAAVLGFGQVATEGIADDAVTYAKIQNISIDRRVLGRNTAGAGNTEELTVSQILDWITATQGAVLFRGATTWAALAPGTAGDQLTTQGAGANPTWSAPGAGGGGASLTRVNASSGAAGADITWQKLSANCAANATTTLATCMTTTSVGAGTWRFRYTIIYQAAATTTGVKLAVNHTGTTGAFVTTWWHSTTGGTAATGVGDQVTNSQTVGLLEGRAERVKNTATFASVGVDTVNSNILAVLEGIVVVTVSGSLEFKHASEVAASSQVMADTTLELHKIG